MNFSWEHPDSPVFSGALKRRRRRQLLLALLAAVVALAIVYGVGRPGAADAPAPMTQATPSLSKEPAQPPEASAATAGAPATDIIREPVLEGARPSDGAAPVLAGAPSAVSAGSAPSALMTADPSIQAATEVRQALQAWAEAWSRRDFAAYQAAYVASFRGSARSRDEWLRQRRERIMTRQRIEVVLTDIVIEVEGRQARVDFRQLYASDQWRDDTRRRIDMRKTTEGWRIAGESNR